MGKCKESYERIAWVKYKNGTFEAGIVKNNSLVKHDVIKLLKKVYDGKDVESQGDWEEHIFSLDEAIGVVTVMQNAICKYVYRHADELRALEEAKG